MEWRLLSGIDEAARQRILRTAQRRRYRRGDTIFHEGDPGNTLHLIAKGFVAIRLTTPLGDSAVLAVLRPGDAFGELALIDPEADRSASATALEDVETLAVHQRDFRHLREELPELDDLLIHALAARVRRLNDYVLDALFASAEIRVVRRLLALAGIYGDQQPGTVVRLTQDDLAAVAGVTRPTANRMLRELVEHGVVHLRRGCIEIVDPDELRRRAR